MSDQANGNATGTTTPGGAGESSPLSAGESTNQAGNRPAPATGSYKEAFSRLTMGEDPSAVNRALFQPAAEPDAKQTATPKPGTRKQPAPNGQPDAQRTPGQDAQGQPAADADPYDGLAAAEVNALKRAKFDPRSLLMMPMANRKAIARSLASSQAELTRQYQRQQAQRQSGKTPAAGDPAAEANSATDLTGSEDEQPLDDESADDGTQQNEPTDQQRATRRASTPAAADGSIFGPPPDMSDEDLATLTDLGGEGFATLTKQRDAKMWTALSQRVQETVVEPLTNAVGHIAHFIQESEWKGAFAALKADPDFKHLELTEPQVARLREEADLLVNAAGKPRTYRYEQALPTAAASLFRTEVRAAVARSLARKSKASLDSTVERSGVRSEARRPISQVELSKRALSLMREAASKGEKIDPNDIRAQVDSA